MCVFLFFSFFFFLFFFLGGGGGGGGENSRGKRGLGPVAPDNHNPVEQEEHVPLKPWDTECGHFFLE